MTTNIIVRDMASQLAHAAVDAKTIGPPKPPLHLALPGAKAAIDHDRLVAYQQAGHSHDTIVERVNARYRADNAARLAEHDRWIAGPYANAIDEMRKREAEKMAAEMRRRALFEELIAERDTEAGE